MLTPSLALLALLVATPASAFVPKASAILDHGLTPSERYHAGFREGGAQDINNAAHCSLSAAVRTVGGAIIPGNATLANIGTKPAPAQFFTDRIRQSVQRAIDKLAQLGDTEILDRRVCIGLYNWSELNARSYLMGYILVDPIAIREMWNLPNRSMFSDEQVYLHEFAHQLQYWYGNPYAKDPTTKRSELAADCVASALLHVSWRGLPTDLLSMEALGMIASAERVGDDDVSSPHHHGTSEQRKNAVIAGKNLVEAHFRLQPTGAGLTSRAILNRCNWLLR